MPIFASMEAQITPLRSPSVPSSLGKSFGTRNMEMPRVPGGASGSLARTRWTMLSLRSWSPPEMKIFEPVIR